MEVREEVMEAARAGLPGLSEQEVQAQLCFALLRSARFTLAKTYLTGTLPQPPLLLSSSLHVSLFVVQCLAH